MPKKSKYTLFFLENFLHKGTNLLGIQNFIQLSINFPSQFTQDELLPFLNTSDNQYPYFYKILDLPPTKFSYLTYDNNSISNNPNIPLPIRPYAQQNPLLLQLTILLISLYKLFRPLPKQ